MLELEVPANLYGMAITEPAALDRQNDGDLVYYGELGRTYVMLFINYLATSLFISQIAKLDIERMEHSHLGCATDYLVLEFGCVFIFESNMLTQLKTSLNLMFLLYYAGQKGQVNKRGSAVLAEESTGIIQRTIGRTRGGAESDDIRQWRLSHLSLRYRIWCFSVVALPNFLLDALLAYVGGVFCVGIDDPTDIVLNTLALVFIVEINDILYQAFTSRPMRYSLETTKPVRIELTNDRRKMMWFANSILCPIWILVLTSYLVFGKRSHKCPGQGVTLQGLLDSANPFVLP